MFTLQGQDGSHFEAKSVPPPLPNKCDWEIDPSELDFTTATLIGKVVLPFISSPFANIMAFHITS